MATITWYLQGSTPTLLASSSKLQFADGTFDGAIATSEYNASTHVESSVGADLSASNTPNNVKYIGASTADWGDGTENLDQILDAECTLNVNFSHTSSVAVQDALFYAFQSDYDIAPTGIDFKAAEQGDTNWTTAETNTSPLTITDSPSATSHDFYIACSASPTTNGVKSYFIIFEMAYV